MIKPDDTEAVVKKVALETDIEVGEPLQPKEVVEYDCPDKDITSQQEVFDCILKMSGDNRTVEQYLTENEYKTWEDKDWNVILTDRRGDIVRDIVMDNLMENYNWKWAYLKKGYRELFGRVSVDNYNSICKTPYWRVEMPMLCVDNVPVFFNKDYILTEEQRNIYRLYNQKTEDFDRMELERKIIWDLIRYSQLGTKTMQDCKDIIERVIKDCEAVGTVRKVSFKNMVFVIEFDWRMVTDTDKSFRPRLLPPFQIRIDFVNNNIQCNWEHPHNLHPNPCLWGTLTGIRDKCFRDRDMHWLVMAMVEFGNAWTSSDAAHTAREPAQCLMRYYWDNLSAEELKEMFENKDIPFVEFWDTVADSNPKWFVRGSWPLKDLFIDQLDIEDNVKAMIERRWEDCVKDIFVSTYWSDSDKYREMVEKYFNTNPTE